MRRCVLIRSDAKPWRWRQAGIFALCLSLAGCGYYGQAIEGELAILHKRQPIEAVIAAPDTSTTVRAKLKLVLSARQFAKKELDLPPSGSFTSYVALKRSYPVWVVYAAPEFSLTPEQWCFPFAGCVPYRGYFHEKDAQAFAARLVKKGDDVFITGVPAYSTLGWFDDPVYSSMLRAGDVALVGMIFHEFAHEKLYIENDSSFNESFADTVEIIGVKRYFSTRAPEKLQTRFRSRKASHAINRALEEARASLRVIYASDVPDEQKREEKTAEFAWLVAQYHAIGERYGIHYSRQWLESLNNASMAQTGTYDRWVPAFERLYRCSGSSLPAFYEAAARIGALGAMARRHRLRELGEAAKAGRACELVSKGGSSATAQGSGGR